MSEEYLEMLFAQVRMKIELEHDTALNTLTRKVQEVKERVLSRLIG
jgi:hypothetical protein